MSPTPLSISPLYLNVPFTFCLSLSVCLLRQPVLSQRRNSEARSRRRCPCLPLFLCMAPTSGLDVGRLPRFASSPSICSALSGRCDVFELDSRAHGCHGDLRTRGDAQDAKDAADVDLDRSFCQSQFSADALVWQTQHHEPKHAALAFTQAQMAPVPVFTVRLCRSGIAARIYRRLNTQPLGCIRFGDTEMVLKLRTNHCGM